MEYISWLFILHIYFKYLLIILWHNVYYPSFNNAVCLDSVNKVFPEKVQPLSCHENGMCDIHATWQPRRGDWNAQV